MIRTVPFGSPGGGGRRNRMRKVSWIISLALVAALALPMGAAQANSATVKLGHQWYEIDWTTDVATMHFTAFWHNHRSQALQMRCQFVARKNVVDVLGYKWVTVNLKANENRDQKLKMKGEVTSINDQSFHVYKNGCWRVWA
jgi:hypothetical protein